jgi:UDP-N-acetylglucosamine 2-epimerase (non-hydrolysing)
MPEEINRVLTDHISDLLFVPSINASNNLVSEGIINGIHFVGDVMQDIYIKMKPHFVQDIYKKFNLIKHKYIVLTLHRDFNVDNKYVLKNLLEQINKLSKEIQVIFPIHPRTRNKIDLFELNDFTSNILIVEPLGYLEIMGLVNDSFKILTDSGGFQKEAYFAGKEACVIMPDTCWIELIDKKINYLVETDTLFDLAIRKPLPIHEKEVYGDGNAARRIVSIVRQDFYIEKGKIE